jgi:hypothetical protein
MLVRANVDGTLTANWTPGCVGFYNIHLVIDGYDAGDVFFRFWSVCEVGELSSTWNTAYTFCGHCWI